MRKTEKQRRCYEDCRRILLLPLSLPLTPSKICCCFVAQRWRQDGWLSQWVSEARVAFHGEPPAQVGTDPFWCLEIRINWQWDDTDPWQRAWRGREWRKGITLTEEWRRGGVSNWVTDLLSFLLTSLLIYLSTIYVSTYEGTGWLNAWITNPMAPWITNESSH